MIFSGHNVTIEARAFATPVESPEIEEVIDLISGEVQRATHFRGGTARDDVHSGTSL